MSNDLINEIDNLSNDKLMSMLGQDVDSGGSTLGRLSINYDAEDADGNLIKRGLYKVETQEHGSIFAEKVSFRPFLNTFQYKKYDEENEENNYKSVMFTSWSDAKPDTNGTDACGSVPKALREDLDPVAKREQEKLHAIEMYLVWYLQKEKPLKDRMSQLQKSQSYIELEA